jgi:hypothetical protein
VFERGFAAEFFLGGGKPKSNRGGERRGMQVPEPAVPTWTVVSHFGLWGHTLDCGVTFWNVCVWGHAQHADTNHVFSFQFDFIPHN